MLCLPSPDLPSPLASEALLEEALLPMTDWSSTIWSEPRLEEPRRDAIDRSEPRLERPPSGSELIRDGRLLKKLPDVIARIKPTRDFCVGVRSSPSPTSDPRHSLTRHDDRVLLRESTPGVEDFRSGEPLTSPTCLVKEFRLLRQALWIRLLVDDSPCASP